jgi:hypothetical protein
LPSAIYLEFAVRVALLFCVLAPFAAGAQQVFKCTTADGVVYQNAPCEPGSAPHEVRRDSNFGEDPRSSGVGIEGFVCKAGATVTYANGFVVNRTGEARRVEVTATFTTSGRVFDTITLPYNVAPFGRTAFSLVGSAAGRCEISYTWR